MYTQKKVLRSPYMQIFLFKSSHAWVWDSGKEKEITKTEFPTEVSQKKLVQIRRILRVGHRRADWSEKERSQECLSAKQGRCAGAFIILRTSATVLIVHSMRKCERLLHSRILLHILNCEYPLHPAEDTSSCQHPTDRQIPCRSTKELPCSRTVV